MGGLKRLVSRPVARNYWYIMKTFNVLPTDPRLQAMTQEQIDFILYNVMRDAKEAAAAQKGYYIDADYADDDESYESEIFNRTDDNWEIMREGQDPKEIYEQVKAKTRDPMYDYYLDKKVKHNQAHLYDEVVAREQSVTSYMDSQMLEAKKLAKQREAQQNQSINTKDLDDLLDDDDFSDL